MIRHQLPKFILLFLLSTFHPLLAQEAEVILGPKLPAGVSSAIITADSHMVMVDLQGRKKQKIASYALPGFEPIEEFTLDLPKDSYFSDFVKIKGGAVAIAIIPDPVEFSRVEILIKKLIPGKFATSEWIRVFEGKASRVQRPFYPPMSFGTDPNPDLNNKPNCYFSGYEIVWSEKENTLYTCVLKSNPTSGTSIHLVKSIFEEDELKISEIPLAEGTNQEHLNHFGVQNGHLIVETSRTSNDASSPSIDHVYVIDAQTSEISSFSVNAHLPANRKIYSNTVFINQADSYFSLVGIIEPALPTEGQISFSSYFCIRYNFKKKGVDTSIVTPLPRDYFESSRGKKRRHIYIDQTWSNPDGTMHLACYSYFTDTYKMTRSSGSAGSSTQSTYTVEAFRSREIILIDLKPDYSVNQHHLFQRNVFHDNPECKRVLAYTSGAHAYLIQPDLKAHYNEQGMRKEFLPETGPSIHTTLAFGQLNNGNGWVFTELKLNSNYTYYPSTFVQSGKSEFVTIAIPSVSKNRICLIKIKEG